MASISSIEAALRSRDPQDTFREELLRENIRKNMSSRFSDIGDSISRFKKAYLDQLPRMIPQSVSEFGRQYVEPAQKSIRGSRLPAPAKLAASAAVQTPLAIGRIASYPFTQPPALRATPREDMLQRQIARQISRESQTPFGQSLRMVRNQQMASFGKAPSSFEGRVSPEDLSYLDKRAQTQSSAIAGLAMGLTTAPVPVSSKTPQFLYRAESGSKGRQVLGGGRYFAQQPQNAARYGDVVGKYKISPDAKLLDLSNPNRLQNFTDEAIQANRNLWLRTASKYGDDVALGTVMRKHATDKGFQGIVGDDSAFGTVLFSDDLIQQVGQRPAHQFIIENITGGKGTFQDLSDESASEIERIINSLPEDSPYKEALKNLFPTAAAGGAVLGAQTTEEPENILRTTGRQLGSIPEFLSTLLTGRYRSGRSALRKLSETQERRTVDPQTVTEEPDESSQIPHEKDVKNYVLRQIERLGDENPFVKIREQQWTSQKEGTVKDEIFVGPFGNQWLSRNGGELVKYNDPNSPFEKLEEIWATYNLATVEREQEKLTQVLEKAQNQGKLLSENDDFALYSVERVMEPPSPEELFERENARRAAFNLPPLEEVPDWIKKEANERKKKKINTVVLHDKQTGRITPLTRDRDLGLEYVDHSRDLVRNAYISPRSPKYQRDKENFRFIFFLTSDYPREIKEKLGITDTEIRTRAPRIPSGLRELEGFVGILLRDDESPDQTKRVYINGDELKDMVGIEEEQQREPTERITTRQTGDSSFNRFNIGQQLAALPRYTSAVLGADILPGLNETLRRNDQYMKAKDLGEKSAVGVLYNEPGETQETLDLQTLQTGQRDIPPRIAARLGSGFIIDDGLVVTNNHVASKDAPFQVRTPDGKIHFVTDKFLSQKEDLAILEVEGLKGYPRVKLGSSKNIDKEPFVISFGPSSSYQSVRTTQGRAKTLQDMLRVTSFEGKFDDFPRITSDAASAKGKSGGPVVNSKGELVGVNYGTLASSNLQPFPGGAFIPVEEVEAFIKEYYRKKGN